MENKEACVLREQTADGAAACEDAAACLRDELTGALIGLVRATDVAPEVGADTWRLVTEGLCMSGTMERDDTAALRELTDRVREEKARLVPDCAVCTAPCGRTADYVMQELWRAGEEIRGLKLRVLSGAREIAANAYRETAPNGGEETRLLLAKALFAVGEDWSAEELRALAAELDGQTGQAG